MMAGRKSKLTPQLIKDAVKLLKGGSYVSTVCEFIGIDPSTWYRWMREGKKAKSGLKSQFYHAIKKADAEAEIRMVTDIQKIANENQTWQALAWMLERKYPERWGRREKFSADVSHTGKVSESHEYNVSIEQKVEHVENKYGNAIERIVRKRIQQNSSIDDPKGI
jgi:transposase